MPASNPSARRDRAIADIVRLSHAGLDGLELLRRVSFALRRVVPFDAYCATVTDPASNLITDATAGRELDQNDREGKVIANYFDRVYFEHDLAVTLAMLQEGRRVSRLSDMTGPEPERSGRYRLHLAPRGLGPEVYVTFFDRGLWGELHVTRERGSPDFTPQELELLNRIVPHVGGGLRVAALRANGEALSEHDANDVPGVLILDSGGRVVSSTANIGGFLTDLGAEPGHWQDGRRLPVAVQVVLQALDRVTFPSSGNDPNRMPRLRVRARSGRWLTLGASRTEPSGGHPGERVVVIGPAQTEEIAWLTLAGYALSPREEDVVRLVVRGLATRQVADQLFIAEHTVQRHLCNVFDKVGVRSRRDLVKRLFVDQVLPSLN